MRSGQILLAAAALSGTALGAAVGQEVPRQRLAASIARVFGPGVDIEHLRADTNEVLRVSRGDSLLGFALVRDVPGKEQPITFLVATDPDDRLKDVDILAYREAYGGEVAYESWRRQFRGRAATDSLRVGREIRSISGATISVNAVTLGVRQALRDLSLWHRAGLIR